MCYFPFSSFILKKVCVIVIVINYRSISLERFRCHQLWFSFLSHCLFEAETMDIAGQQEGRVIRAPQLRRGKEEISINERVIQPVTIILYSRFGNRKGRNWTRFTTRDHECLSKNTVSTRQRNVVAISFQRCSLENLQLSEWKNNERIFTGSRPEVRSRTHSSDVSNNFLIFWLPNEVFAQCSHVVVEWWFAIISQPGTLRSEWNWEKIQQIKTLCLFLPVCE